MRRAWRPALARLPRLALPLWAACAAAGARAAPTADCIPAGDLQRCAAIATVGERVECYDRLAGRRATATTTVTTATTTTAATPATPGTPAAAAATAATTAPTAAGSAAPAVEEFGLSAAQLRPAELPSITARVAGFGRTAAARPTVRLDNGQLWELDTADPLLAAGDSVTIRRAALGSYLLRTPQNRTHHVHRLH